VVAPPPPAPPVNYNDSGSNYAPAPTAEQKQPAAAAASSYALVGTLDRGNGGRPAALFEVNGAASWVNVGETIGDSSWVVIDVTEDRATIERNGETRNLSVGQEF
jgi:Tfp pilus assembly protein PilP